jgi:hypothetical protein
LVQFYHLPSALKLVSCKFWLIGPLNAVYWSCKETILMFGATHMALTSLRPCLDSTGTSSSLGCGQIFWNLVTHGKCWKNLENRTDRCLAAWNFNTVGLIRLKCEANKSWLALRIRLEATNRSDKAASRFRNRSAPNRSNGAKRFGKRPAAWDNSLEKFRRSRLKPFASPGKSGDLCIL